jgi:hypothetical protein
MAVSKQYYTMDYYENRIFNGLEYTLPTEVIQRIQELKTQLGLSNQQNQNNQNNQNHRRGACVDKGRRFSVLSSSWKPPVQPTLKPTVIIQEEQKTVLNKVRSDIRILMNKISEKNFTKIKDSIVETLQPWLESPAELRELVKTIIEIAGSNSFLAKLNAHLYIEMLELSPLFNELLTEHIQQYDAEFSIDALSSPQSKETDRRKAMTHFIVYLNLYNGCGSSGSGCSGSGSSGSSEAVLSRLQGWIRQLREWSQNVNAVEASEELSDHFYDALFIMYTYLTSRQVNDDFNEWQQLCDTNNRWNELYEEINEISEYKSADYAGLSARTIYNFRNIIDKL